MLTFTARMLEDDLIEFAAVYEPEIDVPDVPNTGDNMNNSKDTASLNNILLCTGIGAITAITGFCLAWKRIKK